MMKKKGLMVRKLNNRIATLKRTFFKPIRIKYKQLKRMIKTKILH